MSRRLRIEYKGTYYHVVNHGAARQVIFTHDDPIGLKAIEPEDMAQVKQAQASLGGEG